MAPTTDNNAHTARSAKRAASLDRRWFLRNAALGSAGAALLLPALQQRAAATIPDRWEDEDPDCRQLEALLQDEADREALHAFFWPIYAAADQLDLDGWMSQFPANPEPFILSQNAPIGDVSFNGISVNGPDCGIEGTADIRSAFGALFKFVGATKGPGQLFKLSHASGNLNYGAAIDYVDLPKTFYVNGVDVLSYNVFHHGKIVRRIDYYDTAQLSAADLARLHPGGTPRQSCVPDPTSLTASAASPEMLAFTRAFHRALRSGRHELVAQFFTHDALLIHPLLNRESGPYGLFNQGIQIRGAHTIGRFFKAVLQTLPDGIHAVTTDVTGGRTGGGYEWVAKGIYAGQGIGRNGLLGMTSISLFGNRISRMSVKFDTMQMTTEQRQTLRDALERDFWSCS